MSYQYTPTVDGLSYLINTPSNNQASSLAWQTANSDTPLILKNGGGLIANSPTVLAVTLSFNAKVAQRSCRIISTSTGLWQILLTSGQQIRFGNSLVTSSIAATEVGDALELVYVGNSVWAQASSVGNLLIT